MKILLSWLQEFVKLPSDARQVANDLTMLGLAVDLVTTEGNETILELDITTNRPDCLSHYGVARELAALYGLPLVPFEAATKESVSRKKSRKDGIVEIVASDLCRRYSARIIWDVRVGPSPAWLARRLELVGIRSINNVADATNYILMAYGHPLHAFDLDLLEGGKIIVRRAIEGEPLTTLDGVERRLTPDDLVIADVKRPVALAGIMGGRDTEITDQTVNVLLESAWFEPSSIRRTSKRAGLHTEASHRFERGADLEATLSAANHCIDLIQQLAGGTIDPRRIDAYPRPETRKPIGLRRSELERHLGLEPPPDKVEQILARLGFAPNRTGQSGWRCVAPSYRVDVTRQIDLVEEVARHYGYDKFPSRLPGIVEGRPARKTPHTAKEARVRELCLAQGYDETISSVLMSRANESFGASAAVALLNPLSEESAVMRNSLIPSLLSAVQWNLNRGSETVRLFEVGNIYRREGENYAEPARLSLVATGDRVEGAWNQRAKKFDLFDLKGDLEQLAELFEIGHFEFDSQEMPDYYRTGYSARLMSHGKQVAWLGELSQRETTRWKFRQPVFLAEVFLDSLYTLTLRFPRVQAISRFPAVQRDFSILLPEQTRFEDVQNALLSLGIAELMAVTPMEVFRGEAGKPVAPGKYSLLLRVTLQSHLTTLAEAELAQFSSRIMECLEQKLGAQIRM